MRPISRVAAAAIGITGALLLTSCVDDGNESTVTLIETSSSAPVSASPTPTEPTTAPSPSEGTSTPSGEPADPRVVEEIATGLEAPWGLAFLPNGDAIVTERDTRRVLMIKGDAHRVVELGTIEAAAPQGEAGLLGVTLSPTYDDDHLAYFYVSTVSDNRIVRARIGGGRIGPVEPIFTGIPNGYIHDGGRLVFGPDGYLYASTGEGGEPERAPDLASLGGKILRLTADGDPAPGNPGGTAVWSYGHRNVQGLAFDGDRLWASEFGADSFDELNLIEPGSDYGWPAVEGTGGEAEGYVDPRVTWRTDDASPSGLAYLDGYLWLAALKGERLWRITVDGARASDATAYFVGDYGRMRTVEVSPDGDLWVMTSNRDTRGTPTEGDDRILLVRP